MQMARSKNESSVHSCGKPCSLAVPLELYETSFCKKASLLKKTYLWHCGKQIMASMTIWCLRQNEMPRLSKGYTVVIPMCKNTWDFPHLASVYFSEWKLPRWRSTAYVCPSCWFGMLEGIGNGQVFQLVHFLARQSTCLVKPDIHYQHAHPASSRTRRHRRVIWCCPCWWSAHFTYLFTQRSKGLVSYLGRLTDWMRSWSNAPVERFHVIDF